MKTRVIVTLRAERQVELDVEHEPNEDPCDLTKDDRRRAGEAADWGNEEWDVEDVEVAQ